MSEVYKTRKNNIIFPMICAGQSSEDQEIISIFLHYYRDVGVMRSEGRVLSGIQKAAMLTGNSEGVISKILIEYGLRSNRRSLPQEFLDFIDGLVLRRDADNMTCVPTYYEDLKSFWIEQGEAPFAFLSSVNGDRAILPSFLSV